MWPVQNRATEVVGKHMWSCVCGSGTHVQNQPSPAASASLPSRRGLEQGSPNLGSMERHRATACQKLLHAKSEAPSVGCRQPEKPRPLRSAEKPVCMESVLGAQRSGGHWSREPHDTPSCTKGARNSLGLSSGVSWVLSWPPAAPERPLTRGLSNPVGLPWHMGSSSSSFFLGLPRTLLGFSPRPGVALGDSPESGSSSPEGPCGWESKSPWITGGRTTSPCEAWMRYGCLSSFETGLLKSLDSQGSSNLPF